MQGKVTNVYHMHPQYDDLSCTFWQEFTMWFVIKATPIANCHIGQRCKPKGNMWPDLRKPSI